MTIDRRNDAALAMVVNLAAGPASRGRGDMERAYYTRAANSILGLL
jgi:hypothetical protein